MLVYNYGRGQLKILDNAFIAGFKPFVPPECRYFSRTFLPKWRSFLFLFI